MAIWLNTCLSYIVFPFLAPAEPSENFREILQNVAKPHGVSNMRKLGHLNNFIKVTLVNLWCFYHGVLFLILGSVDNNKLLLSQTSMNTLLLLPLLFVTPNLSFILSSWALLPAGLAVPVNVTLTVNVTEALGMQKHSNLMCIKSSTLTLKPEISNAQLLLLWTSDTLICKISISPNFIL